MEILILEVCGDEVLSRREPPPPVMPAPPRKTVAKVRRPVVVETTGEAVS